MCNDKPKPKPDPVKKVADDDDMKDSSSDSGSESGDEKSTGVDSMVWEQTSPDIRPPKPQTRSQPRSAAPKRDREENEDGELSDDEKPPKPKKPKTEAEGEGEVKMEMEMEEEKDFFQITCLYVGQGDCILIVCPDENRTTIMIDCGSKTWAPGYIPHDLDQTKKQFKTALEKVMGLKNTIDFLILTHSDLDHHNQISAGLLEGFIVTKLIIGDFTWFDDFFLSRKAKSISQKAREKQKLQFQPVDEDGLVPVEFFENIGEKFTLHGKNTLTTLVDNHGCVEIIALELNKSKKCKTIWTIAGEGDKPESNREELKEKFYRVTGDDEANTWSVKIIAAQVEADTSSMGEFMNAASLVTVVQIGNKKAVFTGDATGATLKYILDAFEPNLVESPLHEPSLLQIPHHGSDSFFSNLDDFILRVDPVNLFTSVRFLEEDFCHPRWTTFENWKVHLDRKPDQPKHYIGYWIELKDLVFKRVGSDATLPEKKRHNIIISDDDVERMDIVFQLEEIPDPKPSPEYMEEITELINLLPAAGTGKWSMLCLKSEAEQPERQKNLYAFITKVSKKSTMVFVIQYTRKNIFTNGSNAVNKYMEELIARDTESSEKDESKPLYEIKLEEMEKMIKIAFDNLDVTTFRLSKTGAKRQ